MMENFDHSAQFADQLHDAMSRVVRKAAFDIQAKAAQLAPVDTGNLRNSIYTKTSEGNNYPGGANTDIIEDQVPAADDLTAYVAVGANYGLDVELGTTRMPARPYLAPATEAVSGAFEMALGRVEEQMRG